VSGINASRRWLTRARHAADVCRVYRDPLARFLDYLGRGRRGDVREIKLWNGLRFRVRLGTSDLGIVDEVFAHGVYDRVLRQIRPGETVIDVGSQCGIFALAAAVRGASVRCYEPIGENVERLLDNARLNGYEMQVTTRNVAVAGTRGTKTLYTVEDDTGGSTFFPSIHPDWLQNGRMRSLSVECVTLDDLVAECGKTVCEYVKLDCEGAEYDILRGADPAVLRRVRTLIMEYHPNGDVAEIVQLLRGAGFHVEVSPHPCILYATSRRPSDPVR